MKFIIGEFIEWVESFLSYIPGKTGTLIRMIWYRYRWKKRQNIKVRPLSQFLCPDNIYFKGEASLGKQVFFSADRGKIEIGKNFSCNVNCHFNASIGGQIIISNNVLVGPNVVIRTANHNFKNVNKEINQQGHSYGNVEIENNVWIGANCVILSGVKIGEGSVIAAGAVVNKNVDPYTLVGGVPAKKIRTIN